jgi:D-glycerate 3-kinase
MGAYDMSQPETALEIIEQFVVQQRLPAEFAQMAGEYFLPLGDYIARCCQMRSQTLIVGVNGAQGTGKSTLAMLLKQLLQARQLRCVVFSIDDLYLTRAERTSLASRVHPLLKTRGVPGTHDLEMGLKLIAELKAADSHATTAIPHFDKALDDRSPEKDWQIHSGPVDVIVIEGWCVGALPTSLSGEPINALEQEHDTDGAWRAYIEARLMDYQRLFSQIDLLVMLKAPSMECIVEWRTLQEIRLRENVMTVAQTGERNAGVMNESELLWFIMHYERLTRHMLASMPGRADIVFELDHQHRIVVRTGADYACRER